MYFHKLQLAKNNFQTNQRLTTKELIILTKFPCYEGMDPFISLDEKKTIILEICVKKTSEIQVKKEA